MVGCPIPCNWVNVSNFVQLSVAVNAFSVISFIKSSVFSKVRAARLGDFQRATSWQFFFRKVAASQNVASEVNQVLFSYVVFFPLAFRVSVRPVCRFRTRKSVVSYP